MISEHWFGEQNFFAVVMEMILFLWRNKITEVRSCSIQAIADSDGLGYAGVIYYLEDAKG